MSDKIGDIVTEDGEEFVVIAIEHGVSIVAKREGAVEAQFDLLVRHRMHRMMHGDPFLIDG